MSVLDQIQIGKVLGKGKALQASQTFALAREFIRIYKSFLRHSTVESGKKLVKLLMYDSALESSMSQQRIYGFFSSVIIDLFDDLGPVYAKAMQAVLTSNQADELHLIEKLQLARLYHDWPAMDFGEVTERLDELIPEWHQEFIIEPYPIGVSAISQAHLAIDEEGREWAIKLLKTRSSEQLKLTLQATEQLLTFLKPLQTLRVGRSVISELHNLVSAFRQDIDLSQDLGRFKNFQEDRLRTKRVAKSLVLPQLKESFCNAAVLTFSKPSGYSLDLVLSGQMELSEEHRKVLGKKTFSTALVELFEIGLFHPHPTQSNLILQEDEKIALFDWGQIGELSSQDRIHGSALINALLQGDTERIASACFNIARDHEVMVDKDEILAVFITTDVFKVGKSKGSLAKQMQFTFDQLENLHIPIAEGILLMARTLLVLEALSEKKSPIECFGLKTSPSLLTSSIYRNPVLREATSSIAQAARQILQA